MTYAHSASVLLVVRLGVRHCFGVTTRSVRAPRAMSLPGVMFGDLRQRCSLHWLGRTTGFDEPCARKGGIAYANALT